ncbi:hypothetical protein CPB84DRAFT_1726619 [Gymnopilus junonius]|uniref:Cytochrome b561 domain-containing protein n=1 Tax=Gymnopilus junonius TaxID=109634 RepID=A0A9P5NVY5_GYMJU|nr:hypothetical protein CPB84DRAFT_1726619 [Gymnopilus junonius]
MSFEMEPQPEGRRGDAVSRQIALTSVFITWTIVLINNPQQSGWFALHPTLQSLAVLAFAFGIITLQPTNQPKTKAAGLARHQIAVFIGLPSIVLGTSAVYYNKVLRGSNHFTTWHGTLGLFCMAWLFFQMFLGAGSVWSGGVLFGGGMKAKALWKYHRQVPEGNVYPRSHQSMPYRVSGYILFPLLLFTVHLGGAWSTWGSKYASWFVRFVSYTAAPLAIILGVYTRLRSVNFCALNGIILTFRDRTFKMPIL